MAHLDPQATRAPLGPLLVLVATACALVGAVVAVVVGLPDGPVADLPAPAATPHTAAAAPDPESPREVLRAWDADRSAAWVAGDGERLEALYTPGSVAGRRDVRRLRAWSARSVEVTRLEPQVLQLTVLERKRDRLVLRITDRVTVAATADGAAVPLPADSPSTRRLVLVREPGGAWRMASVAGAAETR